MKCPYCNGDMSHGIISIDSNGTFFEQKYTENPQKISRSKQIARRLLGVFAISNSNIEDCTDAYCCKSCKIVVGIFPLKKQQ